MPQGPHGRRQEPEGLPESPQSAVFLICPKLTLGKQLGPAVHRWTQDPCIRVRGAHAAAEKGKGPVWAAWTPGRAGRSHATQFPDRRVQGRDFTSRQEAGHTAQGPEEGEPLRMGASVPGKRGHREEMEDRPAACKEQGGAQSWGARPGELGDHTHRGVCVLHTGARGEVSRGHTCWRP